MSQALKDVKRKGGTMKSVEETYGTPRAASNVVVSHLQPWTCPECGRPARASYGVMGNYSPRCAQCFDDWRFGDDEELRAKCEEKHAQVLRWMATGETP